MPNFLFRRRFEEKVMDETCFLVSMTNWLEQLHSINRKINESFGVTEEKHKFSNSKLVYDFLF